MLKKLVETALLGTDRAALSDDVKAQLESQGVDIEAASTQVLLEGAAVYIQKAKAGFPLVHYTKPLPISADDADEYACSDNSAYHLQQILNGTFAPALPEFLEYMSANKKQLPPEMLPDMIKRHLEKNTNWDELKKIIGRRGEWLMRQNPDWCRSLPVENPEIWATGNQEERVSVLKYLRGKYPELALEMLQQSWSRETKQNKIEFLKVLAVGVSEKDAAFLENCLDDENPEIRQVAADLCAQINSSDYLSRLSERIDSLLVFTKEKLHINMPEAPDAAGIRDGIFVSGNIKKQGLRTTWLSRIVSLLPPQKWEEKSQISPSDILTLFENSDYAMTLLGAVLLSVVRNRNAIWAEAYLRFFIKKHQTLALPEAEAILLLHIISEKQYQNILDELCPTFPLTANQSPLSVFVEHSPHRLNAPLSIKLVNQFKTFIHQNDYAYGSNMRQKETLKHLAYQVDFLMIEEIKKGWNMNSRLWPSWSDSVENFVRVLQFRRVMKEGLDV